MNDQRLLRRLAEGQEARLSPVERARASELRDALSRALLADQHLRARELAGRAVTQDLPPHHDWTWRPAAWRAPARPSAWPATGPATDLAKGLRLFHDCPLGEVSARQVRSDAPPYALVVEVFAFQGSYLSVAFDLPTAGSAGLRRRHVLRMDLRLTLERPSDVFARLNVGHGSTTAQIVRTLPTEANEVAFIDFDLAGLKIDLAQAERIWIDLIFDSPAANSLKISDVLLSRTPRAEA